MNHVTDDNELAIWGADDEHKLEELDDIDLGLVGGGAFPFIQQ